MSFFKHKSLVSALNRAGYKIIEMDERQSNDSKRRLGVVSDMSTLDAGDKITKYKVSNGDKYISWSIQGDEVPTLYCGKHSHKRDLYDDYFPGHFASTIKSAIDYLNNN